MTVSEAELTDFFDAFKGALAHVDIHSGRIHLVSSPSSSGDAQSFDDSASAAVTALFESAYTQNTRIGTCDVYTTY